MSKAAYRALTVLWFALGLCCVTLHITCAVQREAFWRALHDVFNEEQCMGKIISEWWRKDLLRTKDHGIVDNVYIPQDCYDWFQTAKESFFLIIDNYYNVEEVGHAQERYFTIKYMSQVMLKVRIIEHCVSDDICMWK